MAPFNGLPLYAVFGLRLLVSTWAGPLVTVRRSSDNATLEVGATATGRLDAAALMAFAGSGSAFVTQWWDQTGNGRHAVQTVAAAQPRIVSAGSMERIGATPALVFDGTDDSFLISAARGLCNGAEHVTVGLTSAQAPLATAAGGVFGVSIATSASFGRFRVYVPASGGSQVVLLSLRRQDGDTATSFSSGNPLVSGEATRIIARGHPVTGTADIVLNGTLSSGSPYGSSG
ncbi:arabinofuranosidase catalytic domain-containing protein, partial [Segnochrobactraceae bacterium EtOH-i3]